MRVAPYGGWERCLHLEAGEAELVVTLDVGPRVIRFGYPGEPNLFYEHSDHAGLVGGEAFRSYGGHRLWVAPELAATTLLPDNDPVEHRQEGPTHVFSSPVDRWSVQKELLVTIEEDGVVEIDHRLHNRGGYELELASWALTQLCPGGVAYFPMPEFVAHTERVLPARPMALWHYSDLSDPRFVWSSRLGSLRQDPGLGPQKIGMFVEQGFAAYAAGGTVFVKTFAADGEAEYPDFGCNFETFANERFLELESLGPAALVVPGEYTSHLERWSLARETLPSEPDAALRALVRRADETGRL